MLRKKFSICIIITLILLHTGFGLAQAHRENLTIPPYEVYQNIINQALRGNFEKIENGVDLIKDLVEEIDNEYSEHIFSEMKNSIKKGDEYKIIKTTQKLIYLDTIDLFSDSIEKLEKGEIDKTVINIRSAYLNYLILSPVIQEKDFDSDQLIRKLFRDSLQTLDKNSPYEIKEKNITPIDIKSKTDEIQKQIITFFPEVKGK